MEFPMPAHTARAAAPPSPVLLRETLDGIAVLTLNRPAKLNAISEQMERELCDAVASPEVRRSSCVVFTGGSEVFSAGADLSVTRGYEPEEINAHSQSTGDFAERVAALPQPTLSAIAGYCIGGGLELALATDFRIAEPTAEFRFPEVALGILPSWGGAVRAVPVNQVLSCSRSSSVARFLSSVPIFSSTPARIR